MPESLSALVIIFMTWQHTTFSLNNAEHNGFNGRIQTDWLVIQALCERFIDTFWYWNTEK